ncbi:GntR family transcriptional regulator [Paludibacterium denitrificans]|uniref:GntR family transcriptional regulator n=1 Tax=Paludibacterium denitrificans TaxID=2675226 RepID=UPI001E3E1D1E|nr:winged helix-turn-helix domain-containing protein [Paludibacterium denitrificans]
MLWTIRNIKNWNSYQSNWVLMLRPWSLKLPLQQGSELPLHLQITQAVVADIRAARLRPGDALPSSRVLAADLSINRKTVVLAYDELQAQGWIEQQPRRGAFVSARLPTFTLQASEPIIPAELPLGRVSPTLTDYFGETRRGNWQIGVFRWHT